MPAAGQHCLAVLRHRLLAGAFKHQIRRLVALQRIAQRRNRPGKLLADRRMVRLAGHDPA